ncbi:MAG: molybdopterin-guanine dinucleotide biosynthesis protein B [Candidatus Thorarchaeota archaeon]
MTQARVFSIAGFSNTGKTTLVSLLVRELRARGYSIMTIKHTQHQVGPPEGSDTRRHLDAGADSSVLLGEAFTTVTWKHPLSLTELLRTRAYDFVIIEGMKRSNLPKVWCLDKGEKGPPENVENVVALFTIGDTTPQHIENMPIYTSKNHVALADLVVREAIEANGINESWRTSKA